MLRDFNRATLAVDQSRRITPAAEWLLDNFYLIEEQIQLARRHLPRAYSRELPRLANGPSAGFLRVYDTCFGIDLARGCADRCGLAERVRGRVSDGGAAETRRTLGRADHAAAGIDRKSGPYHYRAGQGATDRNLANQWVERLQEMAEKNPSRIVIVVADMARAEPPLSSSFVAEFCQRLSRLTRSCIWRAAGSSSDCSSRDFRWSNWSIRKVRARPRSSFGQPQHLSLRLLGAIDWKEFVETLSLVEHICAASRPTFTATWISRRAIVIATSLSRWPDSAASQKSTWREKPIDLAKKSAAEKGRTDRMAHVGFYLTEKGQTQLARETGVRRPLRTIVERGIRRLTIRN